MNIKWQTIETNFNGEKCMVAPRGAIRPDGYGVMALMPLLLSGSDVFFGVMYSVTKDGGKTWSPLKLSKNLNRRKGEVEGTQTAFVDVTPFYHKKTGKFILIGITDSYFNDKGYIYEYPIPEYPAYAVWDEEENDFTPYKTLIMPKDEQETYYSCGAGSSQCLELDNGDILIPIQHLNKAQKSGKAGRFWSASVMRCEFDGTDLVFKEVGKPLTIDVLHGLCEPSIVKFNGEYLLSIRNSESGYVTKGKDGLNYEKPKQLLWDNGEHSGNYFTQTHWITLGDKLYLVYTRRGADNDHVFRHRAPLFIAEFDAEKMCLIKETEKIVVPNRGARLGNFGCFSMEDKKKAFVFAAEWMQTNPPEWWDYKVCMKYGSKNDIFITEITFDK